MSQESGGDKSSVSVGPTNQTRGIRHEVITRVHCGATYSVWVEIYQNGAKWSAKKDHVMGKYV